MRNRLVMAVTVVCAFSLLNMATEAQTPLLEWSGTWRISNGAGCPQSGVVITFVERPGLLRYHSPATGRAPAADREVTLAADGSGKLEYTAAGVGPVVIEVPPGQGKRQVKLKMPNTICQWVLV